MSIPRVLEREQRWHVEHGDSLAVLRAMPDACVDAIVTDPPAGISFMGKSFDHNRGGRAQWVAWLSEILAECYRVTKPGGRMLCWSIPRTMHWTGTAIEDAGWEIENTIAHVFGNGFPKAKSQIKPAREDWWIARKPAPNVLPLNIEECRVAPGTPVGGGGNNFDAWRSGEGRDDRPQAHGERSDGHKNGRWPANLVLSHADGCECVGLKVAGSGTRHVHAHAHTSAGAHDGYVRPGASAYTHKIAGQVRSFGEESVEDWQCVEGCPIAELDRQSGNHHPHHAANVPRHGHGGVLGDWGAVSPRLDRAGDSGGASRFFNTFEVDPDDTDTALFVYQAKASKADRNAGFAGHEPGNTHPTLKSTPLMRHLVKLIAKPGDVVLDAFCGSGSTGRGALLEGCRFVGIEREDTEAEPYVTIARRRIADAESKATANGAVSRPDSQVSLSL